jgi:glycine/D-amino acid oxidase-like deaminating enzyme
MKKIAVIGAGLAGLAVTYFLTKKRGCQVDLFEENGIGAGASGIACGLLHPYPGEEGKRSWMADEALKSAKELLQECPGSVLSEGIIRASRTPEEHTALRAAFLPYSDVEEQNGAFLIKSGMTIHVPLYLKSLWKKCEEQGAQLILQKIQSLEELKDYDRIVVAAGPGCVHFFSDLNVQLLKGQLLTGRGEIALARSHIGKGYIAVSEEPGKYILGSTYERNFASINPDSEAAQKEILPKIASFFPNVSALKIEECKAAVRVARKGHYIPLALRKDPRTWVFTALGSRGLLYHAYLGKILAEEVLLEG